MSSPAGLAPRNVVLAYSGGLDTPCIFPWLKEQYGNGEAIAAAVDVGQPDDLSQIEAKALANGAAKAYVIEAREEFLRDYVFPLRQRLDAFVDHTQLPVTGEVRMKLYKGVASAVGRTSPFRLYQENLATFGEDDVYRQSDAEGFIRLFGLGLKRAAQRDRRLQEQSLEVAR